MSISQDIDNNQRREARTHAMHAIIGIPFALCSVGYLLYQFITGNPIDTTTEVVEIIGTLAFVVVGLVIAPCMALFWWSDEKYGLSLAAVMFFAVTTHYML